MDAAQKYTSEIHAALHHYAAWDPGTPLTLGTVGHFIGRRFVAEDHLDNMKVTYRVRKDRTPSQWQYATSGSVEISVKARGATAGKFAHLAKADAGLKLTFNSRDAIWFAADGCLSDRINDQIEVGRQVATLYGRKKWRKEWVFISQLVRSRSLAVLVASASGASVELRVKADVLARKLDLARATATATLAGEQKMATTIVGGKGATPLFFVSGIRQTWLDWLRGTPVLVAVYKGPHGAQTEQVSLAEPPVLEVVS